MVNQRILTIAHTALFSAVLSCATASLAISAALVYHFNRNGYPNGSYRDRIRIILVAAVWMTFFALFLIFGVAYAKLSVVFGIFSHLVLLTIGFLLYLIGTSALTALTRNTSCSNVDWDRCRVVKSLVAVSWVEIIFLFATLVFILFLGIKSRSGEGMRRATVGSAGV